MSEGYSKAADVGQFIRYVLEAMGTRLRIDPVSPFHICARLAKEQNHALLDLKHSSHLPVRPLYALLGAGT